MEKLQSYRAGLRRMFAKTEFKIAEYVDPVAYSNPQ